MFEWVVPADAGATIALVVISLLCFIAGVVLRTWPEKVQAHAEMLDGFLCLISPEAHRAMIRTCGRALTVMSIAALLAAGLVL